MVEDAGHLDVGPHRLEQRVPPVAATAVVAGTIGADVLSSEVRFSAVRRMERYIPGIQDAFRRTGFPIERAGKVRQVTFGPSVTAPVEMVERQRWEYHNREETWSVLVTEDDVILQTTAYTRFEEFAERLQLVVNTVLTGSEHDGFGVIHRVGLRYIDVVRPSAGKGFRSYLRRGLHGVQDEVFQPGRHLLHV